MSKVVNWAAALTLIAGQATFVDQSRAEDHELDMRLMTSAHISEASECGTLFWQKNKDPSTDKYAYAFASASKGTKAAEGFVRVGKTVSAVEVIASGGKSVGTVLQHQVFRDRETDLTVLVDMLEFYQDDEDVTIEDARITVYAGGKIPFPIRVSGRYRCATAGSVASSQQSHESAEGLTKIADIESWDDVPKAVLQTVRSIGDCDHESMSIVWGTHYRGPNGSALWELPCFLGAYQGSMVFVEVDPATPQTPRALTFQVPPGRDGVQEWLMEPRLKVETGTITSMELGRTAADCGKYQRHRLLANSEGGTAFELIEFREKPVCDENFIPVETFPLVFSK